MKKSPASSAFMYALMFVGGSNLLTFALGLTSLGFFTFLIGILLTWVVVPIGFLLCLHKIYNTDQTAKGAGSAFASIGIFIGINFVFRLLILILNMAMNGGLEFISFALFPMILEVLMHSVFLFLVLTISSRWRLFKKAGKGGWEILIPIYNLVVECEIAKAPGWWIAMILIVPIANIVFTIMLLNKFVKAFGKDSGFTVGAIFLPLIFYPLLAYGDNPYKHNNTNQTAQATSA